MVVHFPVMDLGRVGICGKSENVFQFGVNHKISASIDKDYKQLVKSRYFALLCLYLSY